MKKLSEIPAPALAGVIREKTRTNAISAIKNCYLKGADMIDLHLSCLEDTSAENIRAITEASPLPILALNYNKTCDWQDRGYTETERIELLLRSVEAGAKGIDMQGYTFHSESKERFCGEDKYSFTKNNPKEVVTDNAIISKQMELIERVHSKGAEVLLSCHPGIVMKSETVVELALFLEKRSPDIIKIVTPATNREEMEEGLKAMHLLKREIKTPVSYHCNGKVGIPTRIINPIMGGQIAFCVDGYNESATPEQIDLATARLAVDNAKKLFMEE